MNEVEIIESENVREELVSHTEVLEKVGKLALIPDTQYTTTKGVASYFDVPVVRIQQIVSGHRDELQKDGLISVMPDSLPELEQSTNNFEDSSSKILSSKGSEVTSSSIVTSPIVKKQGYCEWKGVHFAYRANLLFTRRAVLRAGMVLQKLKVAEAIRSYLLNVEALSSNTAKKVAVAEQIPESEQSPEMKAVLDQVKEMQGQINHLTDCLTSQYPRVNLDPLSATRRAALNSAMQKLAINTQEDAGRLWKQHQHKHKQKGDITWH